MRWPFVGRRERLRREASDWLARLNGAPGEGDRAAFAQWYGADPEHAATYDRLARLFAAAGSMRPVPRSSSIKPVPSRGRGIPRLGFATAGFAAAGAVVLLGLVLLSMRDGVTTARPGSQTEVLAAVGSDARLVTLTDGSQILLSPGSELDVALGAEQRLLHLRRGEARFTVAHEDRPFVVTARGTEVIARGTQFVVRVTPGATTVALIEGRVEVSYPSRSRSGTRTRTSLTPGQRLSVPVVVKVAAADVAGPAMIEFDDTRLIEAVQQVNRDSAGQVRLADASLNELRVTGAFRAGDAESFAQGVAAALDLEVDRGSSGDLRLRARGAPDR